MKKSFLLVIGLVLLVGGYFVFSKVNQNNSANTPKGTNMVSISEQEGKEGNDSKPIQNDITNTWKLQTAKDYTIKYPNEATADPREDETIITYMGEKQKASGRTQTELFDGYSVRVSQVLDGSIADIEDFASSERKNAVENCDYEEGKVSSLKPVSIGGAKGFQYSAVNCYIDYTEVFLFSNNIYYRVSQSYVGDENDYGVYKKTTEDIVATLNFTR